MCGIMAIFGKSEGLEKDLKRGLEKVKHRGSDSYECKVFDSCALGANRLAIVDQSNGRQPLTNEKGTVYTIQNGEIFNHEELKNNLFTKGHIFKTDCDTETLVHLWEEYGPEMIEKIDSEMFAFCIYDVLSNNFFIARDALGVKPLYYANDRKGRFFIASEIKQLAQFPEINEIHEFPPGHYYYKGVFSRYFTYPTEAIQASRKEIKHQLKTLIEEAVRKRVQTSLPIGVFLSGGVDSSLIMALATRHHKNVTAIILGTNDSPDLIAAVKLCKEKGWRYCTIDPCINYEAQTAETIYFLESYEPTIVRHAYANDLVSKRAAALGLKIVLVGEGADELFAGYNEFAELSREKINLGCIKLVESLSRGHLMRLDKMAMKHTIETRSPFFDSAIVKYALGIPGFMKVHRDKGQVIVKKILREVAEEYVPRETAFRHKIPFANGAGMNVGTNFLSKDGIMGKIAEKYVSDSTLSQLQARFPHYDLKTKEEAYYFSLYDQQKYTKFKEGQKRLLVKDNLVSLNDDEEMVEKVFEAVIKNYMLDRRETSKFNDAFLLKKRIGEIISSGQPIRIVGYWGVEKKHHDRSDNDALQILRNLQENIRKNYPLVSFSLILTDIHGTLNGLNPDFIKKYYSRVELNAARYNLQASYLSDLWKDNGLSLEDVYKMLARRTSSKIEPFLLAAAQKHYRGDSERGALLYKACSFYDKKVIKKEFADCFFFTYNSSKWKSFLPNLTTLSFYGEKKGFHTKPWHIHK